MTAPDIILFTGAVYGIAWTLTLSKLCRGLRRWMLKWKVLDTLAVCIVCTSAWVGLGLALLLPRCSLIEMRVRTPLDALVLMAWSIAATWTIGRATGDAE